MPDTYAEAVAARRAEILELNRRRHDPLTPLSPAARQAVAQMKATACTDPRHVVHLIPIRATICLWCGHDAEDLNRLDLPE